MTLISSPIGFHRVDKAGNTFSPSRSAVGHDNVKVHEERDRERPMLEIMEPAERERVSCRA